MRAWKMMFSESPQQDHEVLPSDEEIAVLMERERCARIAYDFVSAGGDGPEAHKGSYVEAAMKLAAKIRDGA